MKIIYLIFILLAYYVAESMPIGLLKRSRSPQHKKLKLKQNYTEIINLKLKSTVESAKTMLKDIKFTKDLNKIDANFPTSFNELVQNMLSMMEVSNMDPRDKQRMVIGVSTLIKRVSKATSLSDAWKAMEPAMLFNLAMSLNDTSILNSKSPYMSATNALINKFYKLDNVAGFLQDFRVKNILLKFVGELSRSNNMKRSFRIIRKDVNRLFSEKAGEELKTMAATMSPELAFKIGSKVELQDVLISISDYLKDNLMDFMKGFANSD